MISKIDSGIGISVYSTSFEGCGGKIRVHNDDFKVKEVLSKKSMSLIYDDDKDHNGYAVYSLKKHNIDTNHALEQVFKKSGLRLKSLGLKDASAITEQFVYSTKKSKNSTANILSKKFSLEKIGLLKNPISKKDMIGNHFTIRITDAASSSKISAFTEYNKILNFYGYQRFGSKRPVTHLIGRALLQRDFDEAVNLLLCFTSKYDSQENIELRTKLNDKSNYSKIIEEIPRQMDLEKIVLKAMIKHGDSQKAIRTLPLHIRRFYVQAFQSYLFNQTLSMAFEDGENLFVPQQGDVCFDKNAVIGKFENDAGQRLAVPFVGYTYYKKTRFHYQISKILKKEGLCAKDFFIKPMQEISSQGGFRNSSITCYDHNALDGDTISFTLGRGCFATIVLREIMKPNNPILAGF